MTDDLVEVPLFLVEWVAGAPADDVWLADHIRSLGESGTVIEVVAAVGTWVRLRTDHPMLVKQALAKTLSGEVDETFARPWRWARSTLTAERRQSLIRRATARCARLQEAFAGAGARHHVELRHDRDDVEGIRLALNQVEGRDELGVFTKPLDLLGERYVRTGNPAPDARLRRISSRFPEAWWGKHI